MELLMEHLLAGGIEKFIQWVAASGGVAAAIPLLIQVLKKWDRFKWLDEYSGTANRIVAIASAAAATAAISYTYDGAVGQLVISGVTPLGIAKFAINLATQLGVQELVYRQIVKKAIKP